MAAIKKEKKQDKLTVISRTLTVIIIAALIPLSVSVAEYARYEYLLARHPLDYSETVEKYARENNLDKYLVYAIIKIESGFNPKAVSGAGARGLMQIMPDTFDWLREYRLGDGERDYGDMFNPDDNIRYGCYLIAYHLGNYGNIDCALAAYHAGDKRVDEWLKNALYSSDGKTLDKIPGRDTAHYVDKVNQAYKTYLKLYERAARAQNG
ncbi:MAG: lytic transglycosylase domain-containing protein [Oscillospiraceae bacterium]|jgi:soluble lytic murein transglycosylase|nr:lytic transglycosylase domain-containing protein [Oscillospiraceae bacterium]